MKQGMEAFLETVEGRVAAHAHLHLVAFVCSLSAKQQALLMREQLDLDPAAFLFFSEDFESRVKKDVV